jgi:hypothetical protein
MRRLVPTHTEGWGRRPSVLRLTNFVCFIYLFFWKTRIKNDSQTFNLTPLLKGFNSSTVCFMFPLINQYARYERKNNIYRNGNVTIEMFSTTVQL